MSLISSLIEKLTGLDLDGSSETVVERPCANCPSDCAIAGDACTVCEPYKKKLIDWVYHVDHLEDFRNQYEVVSVAESAASGGLTHCSRCGANSSDPYICEYCGSQLAEKPASSGKIQVTAASEIPNPIMQAQDVIYERYDAVIKKYTTTEKSSSGNFFSNLFSELMGLETEEESALGAKMSEAEIKEAAELYKVSVGDYLTGLDNGKYLTLSAKKEADKQGTGSYNPAAAGLAGLAGIGMLAGSFSSQQANKKIWSQVPQRSQPVKPKDQPQRPPQQKENPPRPSQSRWDDAPQRVSQQSSRHEDVPQKVQQKKWEETPVRPSQSSRAKDVPQRVSQSSVPTKQRPESREPEKQPASSRSIPEYKSRNRRDNMISRTTGERKNNPQNDAPTRSERSDRSSGKRR